MGNHHEILFKIFYRYVKRSEKYREFKPFFFQFWLKISHSFSSPFMAHQNNCNLERDESIGRGGLDRVEQVRENGGKRKNHWSFRKSKIPFLFDFFEAVGNSSIFPRNFSANITPVTAHPWLAWASPGISTRRLLRPSSLHPPWQRWRRRMSWTWMALTTTRSVSINLYPLNNLYPPATVPKNPKYFYCSSTPLFSLWQNLVFLGGSAL